MKYFSFVLGFAAFFSACNNAQTPENTPATSLSPQISIAETDSTLQASRHNAITRAVARANDAVVSVIVTEVRQEEGMHAFDPFFGYYYTPGQLREFKSLGSGFIISEDGLVVTNQHVVGLNATEVLVTLSSGESHRAEILGIDELTDLSLLKISVDNPLPFLSFGNSEAIMAGEWSIAMGNPFGLFDDGTPTVTVGVVSAVDRDFRPNPRAPRIYSDMIQTDASINSGNSGGPLLNALGEVIGVNTFIYTGGTSDGFVGLSFAIPSNRVVRIIEQLRDSGKVLPRFDLGFDIREITIAEAMQYGLGARNGLYVHSINRDGPAYEAGILPGDILWKLDKQVIYSKNYFDALIRDYTEGDTIHVEIWRSGQSGGLFEAEVVLRPKVMADQ